jgi:hypothetical protein
MNPIFILVLHIICGNGIQRTFLVRSCNKNMLFLPIRNNSKYIKTNLKNVKLSRHLK